LTPECEDEFDVAVVGAGPAGSAAAFSLAKAHKRVCLIDKARFPREKLCGGLITLRSKAVFERVFERGWKSELFNSSEDISFFSKGRLLAEQTGYSRLYFTTRLAFDDFLLGLARDAGVTFYQNEEVEIEKVDLSRNMLICATGRKISYRYLIGADGLNSVVARALYGRSFNPQTIGFGLEVEVPRTDLESQSNGVEIDFGAANWGYGWVFPKRETFTIGVGGVHQLNPDLRTRLDRYLGYRGLTSSNYKVRGQYIPFGDFRRVPGDRKILLCGDAAGTVDPITGEGIAYAMQSGAQAANAVVTALDNSNIDALSAYRREYDAIASSLSQANFWRRLIFPAVIQKPFALAFSDAGTLQRGYLDILAGKREYSALPTLFAAQVGKGLRKLLFKVSRLPITR
jgi:geranylgeranyl reductase family protein